MIHIRQIPVGFILGMGVPQFFIKQDDPASLVPGVLGAIVGGAVGLTFGPALAVHAVGTGGAPHGTVADAAGGAAIGWAGTLVAGSLFGGQLLKSNNSLVGYASIAAAVALPAIGATLAYDRSRR